MEALQRGSTGKKLETQKDSHYRLLRGHGATDIFISDVCPSEPWIISVENKRGTLLKPPLEIKQGVCVSTVPCSLFFLRTNYETCRSPHS